MSKQSTKPAKDMKHISPVRGILVALVIGGVAQYAFAHDHLLLGLIGYGFAIWFFVSRLEMDLIADSLDDEQGLGLGLFQEELREKIKNLTFIRKNWRQMTIAEIFSGSYKLPDDPDDKEVKP